MSPEVQAITAWIGDSLRVVTVPFGDHLKGLGILERAEALVRLGRARVVLQNVAFNDPGIIDAGGWDLNRGAHLHRGVEVIQVENIYIVRSLLCPGVETSQRYKMENGHLSWDKNGEPMETDHSGAVCIRNFGDKPAGNPFLLGYLLCGDRTKDPLSPGALRLGHVDCGDLLDEAPS